MELGRSTRKAAAPPTTYQHTSAFFLALETAGGFLVVDDNTTTNKAGHGHEEKQSQNEKLHVESICRREDDLSKTRLRKAKCFQLVQSLIVGLNE